MDAFQILVIVLSSVLALCLVMGIIAGIFIVLILKQVKRIAEKASDVADNVEVASEFFKTTSVTSAAFRLLSNASDFIKKRSHQKKDK